MFERTRRGLKIANSSLGILRHNPRLVIFPLLSTSGFIAVVVAMGASMYAGQRADFGSLFFILGHFGLFVLASFVTIFFNAALVACVLDSFNGRAISLRAGLAAAAGRLPQLLSWTLFATTAGLAIAMVQGFLRKLGILGAIAGSAMSLSWGIATYLVVPVLVVDGVGPLDAFRRSMALVKSNWRSAVGVETGIFILVALSLIPAILLIAFANAHGSLFDGHILLYSGIACGIYAILVLGLWQTLETIFRAGVYAYVNANGAPSGESSALIDGAFR